jgi:hypothetical protein
LHHFAFGTFRISEAEAVAKAFTDARRFDIGDIRRYSMLVWTRGMREQRTQDKQAGPTVPSKSAHSVLRMRLEKC